MKMATMINPEYSLPCRVSIAISIAFSIVGHALAYTRAPQELVDAKATLEIATTSAKLA